MALKKRKGFSIESKSLRCKLLRDGIDLTETKTAFNEIVEFYYYLINSDPTGVDIPVIEGGGWRFYEVLTIGEDAQHPLPFSCPGQFRRSAIRKAIGAYRSWRSNYERWLKRSKRLHHHRPPVPPRRFNFSPSFDAGVWKEDTGETIMIKVLKNGEWLWVKFSDSRLPNRFGVGKRFPECCTKRGDCIPNLCGRTLCQSYRRNENSYGSRLSQSFGR